MFKKTHQVDFKAYTIYDSKTDSYREPVFGVNEHDIIRSLMTTLESQKDQNKYYANAEDFSLFEIGDYCYSTGKLRGTEPKHVVNFHELRSSIDAKVNQKDWTTEQKDIIRQIIREEFVPAPAPTLAAGGPGH